MLIAALGCFMRQWVICITAAVIAAVAAFATSLIARPPAPRHSRDYS
jgi:hypothetical protein